MNITQFIKSHKELAGLPFLVVFRTIQILMTMGMLKDTEGNTDGVGRI